MPLQAVHPPVLKSSSPRLFALLSTLLLLAPPALRAQNPCASGEEGSGFPSTLSLVRGTHGILNGRSKVTGDYLVIVYNAGRRETRWYDYRNSFQINPAITRNGSLLPIVDSREKIAVHVCGLHFGDQLTVTTNPLGVPEGGADIRSVTPTTPTPSLLGALDALQNPAASGVAISGGSLGYAATANLGSLTVSGVVPGTITARKPDGTSQYTDATITASGQQVALMMYEVFMNAKALIRSTTDFRLHPQSFQAIPGSIDGIQAEIKVLHHEIDRQRSSTADAAAFDEDVNSTQLLANDITALAATIAAQGFGARAVAIFNNYATLKGILNLSRFDQRNQDPHNDASAYPACAYVPTRPDRPPTVRQLAEQTNQNAKDAKQFAADAKAAADKVAAAKPAPAAPAAQPPVIDPIPAAHVTCEDSEQQVFNRFNHDYEQELERLIRQTPRDLLDGARHPSAALIEQWEPAETFEAIQALQRDLRHIDQEAGSIFASMNEWERSSDIEQTDLIAPISGNALMRISIIVQRAYTPFTLTSSPTPMAVAAIAAASPAAATAPTAPSASTGTPAHAVKTILVEVHRVANFNVTGGVVIFHIPTKAFALAPGTSTATAYVPPPAGPPTGPWNGICGTGGTPTPIQGTTASTTPPAYNCALLTQQSPWQVSAMIGMVYYPFGHDYFPRRRGGSNFARNWIPSVLVGTSVNTLGNAVGALNMEPYSGIDLFAGVGAANSNALPSGVTYNTPLPTSYTFNPNTTYHVGFAAGIAFDLGVFTAIFSKPQAGTMP